MAEKHPDELDLLSYVEEELPAGERQDVVEHLVACRSCAERVRRLEAGREALRAAPLLELPEERRRETIAALPERRDPWRPFRPIRRGLLVAAPVAAAAAFVGVFVFAAVQLGGGGDDDAESGAAAEAVQDAAGAEDMEGDQQAGTSPLEAAGAPVLVRSVRGPATEVVALLERAGIEVVLEDGAVHARGDPESVRAALAGRRAGAVEVYTRE